MSLAGLAITASAWKVPRTGEDRKTSTDAISHAHQSWVAWMCIPSICHVTWDTLYGWLVCHLCHLFLFNLQSIKWIATIIHGLITDVNTVLMPFSLFPAHEFDARRRMISKNFHHVLRMSERMTLVGPPESMREHVVAASKAMKVGDWNACQDFLINDKMNAKVCCWFQCCLVVCMCVFLFKNTNQQ